MKKWIIRHHNQLNIVISAISLIAMLTIIYGSGIIYVLYPLITLLVLIPIGLVLQLYATYFSSYQNYKDSYTYVHEAIHTNRNAYRYLELCMLGEVKYFEETFRQYMSSASTAMTLAFSLTTGKKCRTCIKLLTVASDDSLNLQVIARDRESEKEYSYIDEKALVINIKNDTIPRSIINGEINYFMHGDLSSLEKAKFLQTSRIEAGATYKEEHWYSKEWKLPYISCIFSPIRYTRRSDEYSPSHQLMDEEQQAFPIYYGFFAVDSLVKNVFTEAEHQMVSVFADSLFPVLSLYNELLKDQEYEEGNYL